ncbi:MAG: formimidoylglutamate deiminase [Pseudomonadota bacterium]|nr:formimidoylglutamate deiminase [Rhodospirillaceae bacterium]MEE2720424.1 formimidoylglutamate deiminase [Pseudomonadota bacterium]
MTSYRFDHLYAVDGWHSPGFVTVEDGKITGIAGAAPDTPIDNIGGIALPGIANLHSHAFQRAMAGLSEYRTGAAEDSFWTWRELMYRFVGRIDPADLEAIAAQLYVEMLKAGFTSVGEFQYLHHDPGGMPFGNVAEMTLRTLTAARETGIGITLLPVLYRHGGFGELPPGGNQKRFINDVDQFLRIYEAAKSETGADPDRHTGIAPHSLRAADFASISAVIDGIDADAPIHIHIAEQEKEIADCEAWSGKRPVELLLENQDVTGRWCLVHATHMTEGETAAAARSGAIAGLCPTTEANLGDGIFELPGWLESDGALGIGSDSHISVSVVEELRWLEYGQRLRDRRRNVAGSETVSTGRRLFDAAVAGGARALGLGDGHLSVGVRANIVVLDGDAPDFAGQGTDTLMESWIFSGNEPVVKHVFVGGRQVIKDGMHPAEKEIARRYRDTVTRLLSD